MDYYFLTGLLLFAGSFLQAQADVNCEARVAITENVSTNTTDRRRATVEIRASHTVGKGAQGTYLAGRNVKLLPGFHAVPGSSLRIDTEECDPSEAESGVARGDDQYHPKSLAGGRLILYPNPADQTLNIRLTEGNALTIHIYGKAGKALLLTADLSDRAASINVSNLAPGLYFIRAADSETGEISKRKFMIAR